MNNNITYVAMDTQKKQHTIAALSTESGEFVEMVIANTAREIGRMVKKIKKLSEGQIHFCYEAGVCGFALKRRLEGLGCRCAATIAVARELAGFIWSMLNEYNTRKAA